MDAVTRAQRRETLRRLLAEEKRWPIGAGLAFCMGTGALAYVGLFWVLFG
jgi:hypothetical protein